MLNITKVLVMYQKIEIKFIKKNFWRIEYFR